MDGIKGGLSSTLDSVHNLLTENRLYVNPSKTEYLITATPQQQAKLTSSSISFQGTNLMPTDSTHNLDVIFDKDRSLKLHISSICKTSYYRIRQLCQIRFSLDRSSAIVFANSLVSSKLDYCNLFSTAFLLLHLIAFRKSKISFHVWCFHQSNGIIISLLL